MLRELARLAALSLCAGLAVCCFGQQTDAPEVLFSEDFETSSAADATLPEGWTHFTGLHTAGLSAEQAHGGRLSLKVTDEDAKLAVGLRSRRVAVTPGEYCGVRWWHYGPAGNTLTLLVEWWDADGKRVEARSWSCGGKGEWVEYRRNFKVPDGTVSLTVHANSWTSNVATGYVDDISVTRGMISMWDRTPQPPADVTHPCGLYKPEDIERARRNIEQHEWARGVLGSWKASAKFWVELPEEELSYWIPDKTPFSQANCPVCGANTYMAWGNQTDKLVCRGCGFTWPHPDYPEDVIETYTDPMGQTQAISYYRGKEWLMHGVVPSNLYCFSGLLRDQRLGKLGSLGNVGKAYAFTGQIEYAQAVRRVLLRLADVYPHYIAHDWYRYYEDYGNLQSGKLHGWKLTDATVFTQLATAYDLTYQSGVYSEDDKVKIEEGCFREFKRLMTTTSPRGTCVNDGPFAMGAGAVVGLILGDHEFISWAIEPPDGYIGFVKRYFSREGHWAEASPAYEAMALSDMHVAPEALRGYSDPASYTGDDRYDNLDLLADPLMRKMLVVSARDVMPDGYMPATNDSTFGTRYPPRRAETNYFWYPTELNKRLMAWAFRGRVGDSGDEYALFRREPDLDFSNVEPWNPSEESVIMPGVGWAILRTGSSASDAAAFIDFGPKGSGHGHADRLNIAYWDFGKEMVTDLGYLGWPHPNRPWMITDLAHNTVIVDGKQQGPAGGEMVAYAGHGPVQGIIASAPDVYDVTQRYERSLVFVDHGRKKRYLVDLFEVAGGEDHQYVFHADGETFVPPSIEYQAIDANSLGEPDVGYKYVWDAKAGPEPSAFVAEWLTDKDANFGTRLHMMADPDTSLIYAKAKGLRDRSNLYGEVDLYKLLVRRPGPGNVFISVIEAFKGESGMQDARELDVHAGEGMARAVEISYDDLTDIVVIADADAAAGEIAVPAYPGLSFSGRMGVVSLHDGEVQGLWMLGGNRIGFGTVALTGTPRYEGTIIDLNQDDFTATVDIALPASQVWEGQQLLVTGRSDGAYGIYAITVEGGRSVLKLADEPIITCQKGDRFTIVPSAGLTRIASDTWRVRGQVAQVAVVDGTTLPDGRVKVRANGGQHAPHVYARGESGAWRQIDAAVDGSRVTAPLAPALLDGSGIRLHFSKDPVNLLDTDAPRLTQVRVNDTPVVVASDGNLGYLRCVRRMSLSLHEDGAMAGVTPDLVLVGERGGTISAQTGITKSRVSENTWRLAFRPLGGELPPDEYRLSVRLTDALGNEYAHVLRFTTSGFVAPFVAMPVVGSNGRLSKWLGEYGTMFYRSEEVGDFVIHAFEPPVTGPTGVSLRFTRCSSYGLVQAYIDGEKTGGPVDFYVAGLEPMGGIADLGVLDLSEGRHEIKLEVVGRNDRANGCFIGVCDLVFTPVE